MFMAKYPGFVLRHNFRRFTSGGSRLLLLLLLVHGLEVDLGQMHGRKTTALDQVCDVAAQIGVDDLRTGNAHHLTHLLGWQIADLENAGLRGFHQEHGLVLDLGLHRGGDGHLENTVSDRAGVDAQLNIHRGRLLLKQDGG